MTPGLRHRRGLLALEQPVIMGILNVTPDSFSDGGLHNDPERAVQHALTMVQDGASVIDIGGESTRPGAQRVSEDIELERVLPVIRALRPRTKAVLSIDTTRARVADAALDAGADLVNDISGLTFAPAIADIVAAHGAGCVLMHTPARPEIMMDHARYTDVVAEVSEALQSSRARALEAGVAPDAIALDPGFGFGKHAPDNWRLLRELPRIASLGAPVLVGISRKRMLRECIQNVGLDADTDALDLATAVACAHASLQGARILRVHNVRAMALALGVASGIQAATPVA